MSKKTLKRHYRKHRKSCKRTYKKHYKKHKRTYRKNRLNNGTGKGVQLFTKPKKMRSQSISVTPIQSGNMIPGLRNM
jgi:hypothetical protein